MTREFRIVFRARDYGVTVGFYRDGLELQIDHSWDRGPGQRGTVFVAASGLIEVLELAESASFAPATGLEIGYEVNAVDEWYDRIKAKGIPISGDIADKPWGHRTFSLTDPCGIKVVVYSIIGKD
ncbi:MAG: VOC family protein [Anaerolineae bacterium]|nr:VOC family protein [Anaerolineae bacterium]